MQNRAGEEQKIQDALTAAEAKIQRLKKERERVIALLRRGVVDDDEGDRELDDLRKQLEYWAGEVSRLEGAVVALTEADGKILTTADVLHMLAARLGELSDKEWSETCRTFVKGVMVFSDKDARGKATPRCHIDFYFDPASLEGKPEKVSVPKGGGENVLPFVNCADGDRL